MPAYEAEMARFAALNTQVLGISVDHVPSLQAWADSLCGINYPLLADFWPHGKVAHQYGVLRSDGRSERAIFLIDAQGVIRYIDIHDIDLQPDNEVLLAEIGKLEPGGAPAEVSEPAAEALPSGGIVMYCTKWCKDCRKARLWLQQRNLDYIEVDVYAVPGAARQVREWGKGVMVTPVFDIDGQIVVDFDQERLLEILG